MSERYDIEFVEEQRDQANARIAELEKFIEGTAERNAALREALEWYAAESAEKFQIVDSKGEVIASFASFTSRARAALEMSGGVL